MGFIITCFYIPFQIIDCGWRIHAQWNTIRIKLQNVLHCVILRKNRQHVPYWLTAWLSSPSFQFVQSLEMPHNSVYHSCNWFVCLESCSITIIPSIIDESSRLQFSSHTLTLPNQPQNPILVSTSSFFESGMRTLMNRVPFCQTGPNWALFHSQSQNGGQKRAL